MEEPQGDAVPSQLALEIAKYGYPAIFLLVLLQELGVPNPVTNEFVLLLSGYLAFTGVLNLWLVLASAVSADFIGTTILYAVFFRWGGSIIARRPRWLPISPAQIETIAQSLSKRRQWGIYVARLVPFLRGYASVAAGILAIQPRIFVPAVLISAITWSGGYVLAGRLLGPYWEQFAERIGSLESLVLVVVLIVSTTIAARALRTRRRAS
jgi:membrane protein DedA with SNARE-associated domain